MFAQSAFSPIPAGFHTVRSTSPSQREDGSLVLAAAGGDRTALSELYRRYYRILLRAGRKLVGEGGAEDLVQDVLLEAWRRAVNYDPQRCSVRGWLLMILRSRGLDILRSAACTKIRRLSDENLETNIPLVLPATVQAPLLTSALCGLPKPQQDVVVMTYYLGYTSPEIAKMLKVPVGTVKSRMRVALETLRGSLGDRSRHEQGSC